MIVGGRNNTKYTAKRLGVCVVCTKNVKLGEKWQRIRRPVTGMAHDECMSEEG